MTNGVFIVSKFGPGVEAAQVGDCLDRGVVFDVPFGD